MVILGHGVNLIFILLMKQKLSRGTMHASMDHHLRQVGPSTGRLLFCFIGTWDVLWLSLSHAKYIDENITTAH